MVVSRYRPTPPVWLWLLVLAGCAGQPVGLSSPAQAPPLESGMARVWVLRQANLPTAPASAAPIVSANGGTLGPSREGTVFFHDFPPGTYRFFAEPYGVSPRQAVTLQLAPAMETCLEVVLAAGRQASSGAARDRFALRAMSPEAAKPHLRNLAYLGQR